MTCIYCSPNSAHCNWQLFVYSTFHLRFHGHGSPYRRSSRTCTLWRICNEENIWINIDGNIPQTDCLTSFKPINYGTLSTTIKEIYVELFYYDNSIRRLSRCSFAFSGLPDGHEWLTDWSDWNEENNRWLNKYFQKSAEVIGGALNDQIVHVSIIGWFLSSWNRACDALWK